MNTLTRSMALSLLAFSGLALAQDQPRGWRRVGDPAPQVADQANPYPNQDQNQNQYPSQYPNQYPNPDADRAQAGQPEGDAQQPNAAPPPNAPSNYPQDMGIPPRLMIKAGTYITVRVNQPLSSDHNQPGDAFQASLARPIVVDGIVVAQTGQTLGGRVAEAQKAGRVTGVSRLGLQLTDLMLVDGQQVPIQSQLITRNGSTSEGRDAAAIAGTTGLGAAVGAAAGWGRGAAIGAGAGAAVGIIGVLLTRGNPTVVYPEQVLTFRIEAPVTVATDRAPQAFRYVEPGDYNRPPSLSMQRPPARPGYPAPAPYYYGAPYYGYPYYPYAYGPGVGFYFGPRYFWGYGPNFYFRGYRR